MNLLTQTLALARIELCFFTRYPRMLLAAAVVMVIPALYLVIYLASVWDPGAHTGELRVALVNLDRGASLQGHSINLGQEIVAALRAERRFGYLEMPDAEAALARVRNGQLAFALILPADFSAASLPGSQPGAGQPLIHASEGNNYQGALLARHFAETLGHKINEELNAQRWQRVIATAQEAHLRFSEFRQHMESLREGARRLSQGAGQTASGAQDLAFGGSRLNAGVEQLTSGVKQLGSGLKTMDAALPPSTELQRLASGAERLASSHEEFGNGLFALQRGASQLNSGLLAFKDEFEESLFIPTSVSQGVAQLAGGLSRVDHGLTAATEAEQRLADGALQLRSGVDALTQGMQQVGSGIQTMVRVLPQDQQLDELSSGAGQLSHGVQRVSGASRQVAGGAQRLAVGIEQLASALPASLPWPAGNPLGLARSVEPRVERVAPVANSGSSFAPNVLAAALWLGAGIAAFLLHARVLPQEAQAFSRPARLAGKLALPAGVVLAQALVAGMALHSLLRVDIQQPAAFALTLALAAMCFLLIVFALTLAFGDAGKAIAMLLLAVQLSCSGGVLPVELNGGLFASISPWLPVTWTVRALKASLFGAYAGAWQAPVLQLALCSLLCAVLASRFARWRFTCPSAVRPAVDI
ncbi:YhgE/Pip domain-containing protein [Uliginosibacterium sp. TH139]|uniref:YhgE/Pip domain-containing protein n=1 Tax=Uliginosibacterium sp. TH139 TaxID=2067453 RepID=UPI000C7BB99A|nr:YhgE/Pip domain-containing protein [Uliginosibacterium sp. TH139]PLK47420.1 hypothetical protein C0V76_17355 [Uliginosibacterium sp. TH139]